VYVRFADLVETIDNTPYIYSNPSLFTRSMPMQSMPKLIVALLIALSLTACQSSGDKQAEPEANPNSGKKIGTAEEGGLFSSIFKRKPAENIILPPDLVSSANDTVRGNHDQGQQSRQEKVLPKVIGAEIVREGDTRWLRVDSDAQNVWDTLAGFWAEEQIELVEFKPAAGLMETDWIETGTRSERDKDSALRDFFNRITGKDTSFDKFKVRLERESETVTNVFVSHRATERKESNFNSPSKAIEWEWVERDSDPEKVAELLQVMILLFQSGGHPDGVNAA
jgi:outer membrane protein assembly factor BamC